MKRTLFVGVLSLWLSTAAIARLSSNNPTTVTTESQLVIDLQNPYRNLPSSDVLYSCMEILANRLNVSTEDLYALIHFETGGKMNPLVASKTSSAKGLLQFTDASARRLVDKHGKKLQSSQHLINVYPTVREQLEIPTKDNVHGGPVYQYLNMLAPFKSSEDLYMAVMYPPGRSTGVMPGWVRKQNAGIKNAKEFVLLAKRKVAQSGLD
jgi:hypothetical protein